MVREAGEKIPSQRTSEMDDIPSSELHHKNTTGHRWPKLKITDKNPQRDSWVLAYKVVLCYNGLNYKGLYGKTMDLF